MTTSTPPAWAWREEKYLPVPYPGAFAAMAEDQYESLALSTDPLSPPVSDTLSGQNDSESPIGSRKLPDSATLRKGNGGPDPTGEDVWPLERDQCSDCRCAPGQAHAPDCDGVRLGRERHTNLRVGARNDNPPETTSPADSFSVESCPECGTVTDIEYTELMAEGYREMAEDSLATAETADSFSVPFLVQEWLFESLVEEKLAELPHLIFTHSERIIEMARDRFRKGYARYGSAAYQWDAETRMTNVLEELADAVVYLTTGSVG